MPTGRVNSWHAVWPEIQRDKSAVIGGTTTVAGSYSWTNTAEAVNSGNTLVLRDITDLAEWYIGAFAASKRDAFPPDMPTEDP